MKAPRVLLFALSLLITQALASQSITKSVIGTSGLTQSNDHFRLSWTIGEPVVGTMTHEDRQLGNGFFQSLDYSLLVISETELSMDIIVYPNPSSQFFTCRQKDRHRMHLLMTDLDGKLMLDKVIQSGDRTEVLHWKQGTYLLEVTDLVTGQMNLFKIVKQNQ